MRERDLPASDALDDRTAATVQRRLNVERLSRIGAWTVAVVGGGVLLSTWLGFPRLSVLPESISMKPSSALGLLLGALALVWVGGSGVGSRSISRTLSVCVTLIGAATLAEHLFGLELRLNQLVSLGLGTGPQAGRMAAGTAASLVFVGLALFNLKAGKRRVRFALCSATAVLALSWLALIGYAYHVSSFYDGVPVTATALIALDTACTLFVLGLAILGAEPAAGLVGIATSDTAGGALARRLVPTIPIVFLVLGWAWLEGAQHGLYEQPFGISLMVLSATALGVVGLGWHAWLLHRSDLARRRAESGARALALSLADRKFEDLLESTSDAVLIVDRAGAIVRINAEVPRLFGYERSELLGKPLEMLLPERFRARHVGHRAGYARDPRVRDMSTSQNLYALRKDGSEFQVKVSLGPVQTMEGLLFSSVVRDITAHRRAEQDEARLAAIVASTDDAIFSKTQDGVIQSWNRGAERMFGYSAEEVIGHSVLKLFPEPLLHEEARMLNQVREGKPVDPYETMRKRKDGSTFDVALTVSLIKDARGRVIAISTIARDITERKVAERKLRASLEEKETLLREIHHRVKNNLAAISSLFYLESAHAKQPETVKLLQEARDRVLSMAMVYEKLYESPSLSHMDFGRYLQSLLEHLQRTYRAQRIEMQVNTHGVSMNLNLAVPCATIANELVTNCLKHAFPGERGGRIWIDLERRGGEYLLRIADDGEGVPADFEPSRSGTLGLRLVRSLVGQIDGRLSFRNANPGLEVLLCFPSGGVEPA